MIFIVVTLQLLPVYLPKDGKQYSLEHEQACTPTKYELLRYCVWGRGHRKLTS